ncbi:MAG TPA: alginate lyase family protein [Nitrospirota bacterium]|nr:alginate lyase family protein [Nitrospirota bacterium]
MPGMRYYMHQLRVLPLREIVKRASEIGRQFTRDRLGKVRARVFGTTLSDRDFLAQAFGAALSDKDAILAHFRARKKPSFFAFCEGATDGRSGLSPQEQESVTTRADRICGHVFDLLGSGDVGLGGTIDWHKDFKTGYRWDPGTYFRDVEIPYGKADIKVPWELSRFYHAAALGQAYQLTRDEKYAREFVDEVSGWIDANRPKFGVNWACAMDVAIRACNWLVGYAWMKESPAFTDEFLIKFLKSLYQHGLHIRNNLEYSEALTSNHYLSDIVGLVYLSVMFPEFREAAEWRRFGVRELSREMEKQVYPDGCDFEASTCYHRLVLELFFYSTLLVVVNDPGFGGRNHRETSQKIFGKAYTDSLYRMFEAVLSLLKPNGMMPQIGDNDSGRLHVFVDRNVLDMRYLLALGTIFFHEPKFKVREFGFCVEARWVFGENGVQAWRELPEGSLAGLLSVAFADAGWYIMRNNTDYLIVSCGPNGQNGNGGHAHNDRLSFELCLDGRDCVIDPGTYLYTSGPEMRNLFRSTGFHSTVCIDGAEQNGMMEGDSFLFLLPDDAHAGVTRWETGDTDIFLGEHHGYERLPHPVVHRREIRFSKTSREWIIIDSFLGNGEHTLYWNFVLSPDVQQALRITSETVPLREEKALYSAEYGACADTKRLRGTVRTAVPFEAAFLLQAAGPVAGTSRERGEGAR